VAGETQTFSNVALQSAFFSLPLSAPNPGCGI